MQRISAAGLALAFSLVPVTAAAQVCMGIPSVDRQSHLQIGLSKTGDLTGYGVGFGTDFEGPIFGSLGYRMGQIDDVSENLHGFGAIVGYELTGGGNVSVCPGVGLDYEMFGVEEFGVELDVNAISIGGGVAVGSSFTSDALTITPFVLPQFIYSRLKLSLSSAEEEFEETDSIDYFLGTLGFTVSGGQLYASPRFSVSSEEDSDPSFGIEVGVVF